MTFLGSVFSGGLSGSRWRVSVEEGKPRVVRKSLAYVTWKGRVLLFRASEVTQFGAELPGGTLESGEDPLTGVLREAGEETGLETFGAPRLLGVVEYDPRDGSDEVHRRHFFHVPLLAEAPEAWSRVVEEGNGTFTFNFFWTTPADIPEDLFPGHDAFVGELCELLALDP